MVVNGPIIPCFHQLRLINIWCGVFFFFLFGLSKTCGGGGEGEETGSQSAEAIYY